jgi:peroxiredoxin Q/BCP
MAELKEGDPAPAFESVDQDGKKISLKDFRGKRVVLYFYPKDDTPGCTAEACNLRDNYRTFLDQGFEVVGVSADSEKSHQKFIRKYDLPFRLVSDVDRKLLEAYGAWGEKSMYGKSYMGVLRKTFIIGSEGIIEKIIGKVNTKEHSKQIFEELSH